MKEIRIPDLVLYVGSGEWSGLYADGDLVQIGDHYLADEKIREYSGVKVVHDDGFLLGGDGIKRRGGKDGPTPGPAKTLTEVDRFIAERELALRDATKAREEAARLLAEAEQVEARYR